jgi:hypothetical protein
MAGMTKTVYSMTVLTPINFPDEIEISIHGLDPSTQQPTGENYTYNQRRSWEWIRNSYPLRDLAYFDECEGYLKAGQRANLSRGEHSVTLDDQQSRDDHGQK